MRVIGIEKLDYVSKKSGRPVVGFNIYCVSLIEEKRGVGYRFPKSGRGYYFSLEKMDGRDIPQLDDEIDVQFDEDGRAVDFKIK